MSGQTKPTGDRGAAYIRVSHGDTKDNEFQRNQNPDAQRAMILSWAERHHKTISEWYRDVEGRNPRDMAFKRKDFQRLIHDVQNGLWDWVVVDSQDRIDPADSAEMGYYITIFRHNDCELWSVDPSQGKEGLLTSTDIGAVFSTTVGSVTSAADLKERGKRQVSRKRERAKRGEWQGGYVPFGFDVVCLNESTHKEVWRVVILKMVPLKGIWHRIIVYPDGRQERCDGKDAFPRKQDWERLELAPSIITERVEIAEEIFDLFASGAWSPRQLCHFLNQRHIDPVTGEGWYHSRLLPMLKNPVYYLGQTVWGKNSHGKNAWYVGGEYLIPPRRKGKPLTGRKNKVEDWVFPPAGTAIITKELFDEVQTCFNGKCAFKRGLRDARLWLAELIVCDRCGQKMSGRSQDGLSYYCTTYSKYGAANPTGCRLHRVRQEVIESYVERYLDDIEPDVRALIQSSSEPALLQGLVNERAAQTREFWIAVQAIRDYLLDAGLEGYAEDRGIDLCEPYHCWAILELYQEVSAKEHAKLERAYEQAKEELRTLISNMNRIPVEQTEAVAMQQELIAEANEKVKTLKDKLIPLDDRLEAAYGVAAQMEEAIQEARAALPGEDARKKALLLRKLVSQIRLTFRHYEHRCRDRRAKTATVPRSSASTIEFVPVKGGSVRYDVQPLTVATSSERG